MIVGFLQNPWFKPTTSSRIIEQYRTNPKFRRMVLAMSRSGRRLLYQLGEDLFNEIHWENCNPRHGRVSSAKMPPDEKHIQEVLTQFSPKIVIAFGEVAEQSLTQIWPGSLLILPHPACRVVTNELFKAAAVILRNHDTAPVGRSALRQRRGTYVVECIPGLPQTPA